MPEAYPTKRPRDADFEVPDLKRRANVKLQWPPRLVGDISIRLRSALIGPKVTKFLRSVAWEASPAEDSSEWCAWRYLGAGSYGAVALWIKENDVRDRLDEVVIKESAVDPIFVWTPNQLALAPVMQDYALPHEAFIQSILNHSKCQNIVHLRDFKTFVDIDRHTGKDSPKFWRFYLEHAPHGDLGRLIRRQRAFHRYLPEPFLWHVFDSLAAAVCQLQPTTQFQADVPGWANSEKDAVLHFDIKPHNIFLGYQEMHDRHGGVQSTGGLQHLDFASEDEVVPFYPCVKLGDFGLAAFKGPIPRNCRRGTEPFMPPEQTRSSVPNPSDHYGETWNNPPNGRNRPEITAKMNIWGIGKARDETEYLKNNNQPLRDWTKIPFSYDQISTHSPYTPELTSLVRHTMEVKPEDRPTAEELLVRTRSGLKRCMGLKEHNLPSSVRNRKLYFRGNEINDMPHEHMNCYHQLSDWEYQYLLAPGQSDPDDPPLQIPPDEPWTDLLTGNPIVSEITKNNQGSKERPRLEMFDKGWIREENDRLFFDGPGWPVHWVMDHPTSEEWAELDGRSKEPDVRPIKPISLKSLYQVRYQNSLARRSEAYTEEKFKSYMRNMPLDKKTRDRQNIEPDMIDYQRKMRMWKHRLRRPRPHSIPAPPPQLPPAMSPRSLWIQEHCRGGLRSSESPQVTDEMWDALALEEQLQFHVEATRLQTERAEKLKQQKEVYEQAQRGYEDALEKWESEWPNVSSRAPSTTPQPIEYLNQPTQHVSPGKYGLPPQLPEILYANSRLKRPDQNVHDPATKARIDQEWKSMDTQQRKPWWDRYWAQMRIYVDQLGGWSSMYPAKSPERSPAQSSAISAGQSGPSNSNTSRDGETSPRRELEDEDIISRLDPDLLPPALKHPVFAQATQHQSPLPQSPPHQTSASRHTTSKRAQSTSMNPSSADQTPNEDGATGNAKSTAAQQFTDTVPIVAHDTADQPAQTASNHQPQNPAGNMTMPANTAAAGAGATAGAGNQAQAGVPRRRMTEAQRLALEAQTFLGGMGIGKRRR